MVNETLNKVISALDKLRTSARTGKSHWPTYCDCHADFKIEIKGYEWALNDVFASLKEIDSEQQDQPKEDDRIFSYNWDAIDKDCNYVAIDEDGDILAYENEPICKIDPDGIGYWWVKEGCIILLSRTKTNNPNWKTSLQKRPTKDPSTNTNWHKKKRRKLAKKIFISLCANPKHETNILKSELAKEAGRLADAFFAEFGY